MTEPSRPEPRHDSVSDTSTEAPLDMGVPLRLVMRNERRRRLRLMAHTVGGPLDFVVRFVFSGDGGDDNDDED